MKTIAYEHSVAIASFHRPLARVLAGVQMLKCKSFRLPNPVIIDLVQIDLGWRIVHVVLVGWIAGPVSARRINLDDHEFVRGKSWHHHIHDLPRRISTTPQTADDITGGNQPWFRPRFRRHSAFGDFTGRVGFERDLVPCRCVDRIRKTVEDILALSYRL